MKNNNKIIFFFDFHEIFICNSVKKHMSICSHSMKTCNESENFTFQLFLSTNNMTDLFFLFFFLN